MTLPESGGNFDASLQNYYAFIRDIGIRDGCVARQVHGTEIVEAEHGNRSRPLFPVVAGDGDAIWTSERKLWVGVYTADCLPVLMDGGDRVMAVHAGWRGMAGGILRKAVEFLGHGAGQSGHGAGHSSHGAGHSGAKNIRFAILGPAASGCCYEVGEEVVDAMRAAGIDPVMKGRNLDLPLTAEAHLRSLGVADIRRSDPFGCTICDKRFRSFRRDGVKAGRSLAAIALGEPDRRAWDHPA